jgi:hypothetical protein
MEMKRSNALSLLLAGYLTLLAGTVLAQEAAKKPHVPLEKTVGQVAQQAPVASLLVINAGGAKLEGDKLTLTGVSANSIVFADRPVRAAGHITTDEIVKQWGEGADNFEKDPPNATVSVLGGGSDVGDAVVTLKSPKLDGTTLTFDVTVLEGNLSGASGLLRSSSTIGEGGTTLAGTRSVRPLALRSELISPARVMARLITHSPHTIRQPTHALRDTGWDPGVIAVTRHITVACRTVSGNRTTPGRFSRPGPQANSNRPSSKFLARLPPAGTPI